MDTKWLEDFISLAETRSFSRSAELRHVTQPAFSRRIQSLEAWLGADLIDRTSYPTRLTPAGEVFYEQAMEMLGQVNNARALLRGNRPMAARHDRLRRAAYAVADLRAEMDQIDGDRFRPDRRTPDGAERA